MARIGMTVSRPDPDAPLAGHFGKARWLLVVEAPDRFELLRNEGLDGRSVAEVFASHGCTDVIALRMGWGAYAHVTAAGMRVWEGDAGVTARVLAERLAHGALQPLAPGDVTHGHAPGARGMRH
jgi:predicted Fe-Mo cluster-binding NifX family protein